MSERIAIRNPSEIKKLRKAGEVSARILMDAQAFVRPGVSTREINDYVAELFIREKCGNAFFGYYDFPGRLCISVNEVVVHGIGSDRILQEGDIVSLDVGAIVDAWYGDNALTVCVGDPLKADPEVRRLLMATEESLFIAIAAAKHGTPLLEVCGAIEDYIKKQGFGIVRDFVGHGIGRKLHEEPQIPNYRPDYRLPRLKRGMVLAIEPMITQGSAKVQVLGDKWTTVTKDGGWAAHFEHTIVVGTNGGEILTERPRIALPEHLGLITL